MANNLYLPHEAEISWIEEFNSSRRLFGISFTDKHIRDTFNFIPGQFIFISLPGHGEAAISIASHPKRKDHLELLITKVGSVTSALFALNVGAKVGIRGPFGNGFDIRNFYDKDVVLVAGGCGIAPLRPLMDSIVANRKKFGKVYFIYGAKNPNDILFQKDLLEWQNKAKVLVTVEEPSSDWHGKVGVITKLFDEIKIPKTAAAVTCGSPAMFKFVLVELKSKGLSDKNIYLSLERRMKCGIGKCQHCTCGEKYVCIDGPVFSYAALKDNDEAML